MICTPNAPSLITALALALAGCGAQEAAGDPAAPDSARAPGSAIGALLKQAGEAMEHGDLADAGRLLDTARAAAPDDPALWVAIARLRYRGGEHLGALEAADRALELGPRHAPALLLKAQLVRDAHGLTDALGWFEAALEADPDDLETLREYAATLGDAGYYTEMLEVVRAVTDIAPTDPRALYLRAVLAARAGEPVLAQSLLERSGLAQAGVPAAMLLDALVDLQERHYDSAAEKLAALAARQPGNQRVAELLARALWLGGRDGELVERFAQAARGAEASPYLIMLVGRALERRGDRAAAAPFLERAYAGRSEGWVSLPPVPGLPEPTARMRELVGAGRLAEANRFAGELQRRFPGSSDIAVLAGDAALASGRAREALEAYRQATRVRRPWPLTRKAAAAYRDFGDPRAADVLLARHLAGEPRNTEALLVGAELAARRQDWAQAARLLDHAITLGAGNDPRLLKLRSIAARALGDAAGAARFERMTWDLHPGILPQG